MNQWIIRWLGMSGVTVKDYGRRLEANLIDLHERLKDRRYVAPLIKRVWIDKAGGKKKRPIGISEIEDKVVQKAVSMLMGAAYEQDFHPFSYGFREEHTAHQALGEIREQCMKHGIRWIYDGDISGFFDNIDRGWLRDFIRQRINDGGLLRLIGKWLNAGVMEGDQITYSDKGTPQGGVISPCPANVFLHHVLDEWFVHEVKPRMRGHCFIVRFADDFVIGFQREDDARRVMEVLPKRKTARTKVRKTVQALWIWCRNNRHMDPAKQCRILCSKLRGHFQYFGVRCNMRAMDAVLHHARHGRKFWLNRRSSKKALNWEKFEVLLESMPLPTPKIIHHV